LDIVIDQHDLDTAEEHVRQNVAEREERVEPDEEDWKPRSTSGRAADDGREVKAIFARLADGA
jgi:hypothetical protein